MGELYTHILDITTVRHFCPALLSIRRLDQKYRAPEDIPGHGPLVLIPRMLTFT
jgi:hypothetical protein